MVIARRFLYGSKRRKYIYKRKDGRWEGRYIKGKNSDGKATYGYVYSKTYNEVKEKLTKAKNDCKIYFLSENSKSTLSDFALQWLESVRNNCKLSTYVKYRTIENLTISTIQVNNTDGDIYYIYSLNAHDDVFDGDIVNIHGLPVGKTSYENVSGGSTHAVVLASAYIEKVEQ